MAAVLADAVLRRVTNPGPVNLAFGTRVSLLEVIGLLEVIMGRSLPRNYTDPRPGDVRDSQADQQLLRRLFPAIASVGLEEGLAATVSWLSESS